MQHTILTNTSCLAVFQAAAADARQLTWELDKDKVSEEDIASLPVHHCYVRATIGDQRLPTFSMTVRKPQPGDPYTANRIRDAELARPTSATMQQPIENVAGAHTERKTPRRRQRSKRNTTPKPNDTTNEAPQENP